ncbi:DNA-directed RNA polymerase subunit beta [Robertmurraya yapensis]|uniref:DNA-directed RNA polymerase subunit beta n=1 Tax=Bacillus yapensis TaxID=2492960 RepID=A0A431WBW7_9BACI|nr:DNA-directed RNA polymerase subunit beta [Bacillus yapensis]RTR32961.1 DNA-directed RNA polymerase subunit beta [Bacillus yapensis]TKS96784.1 DNA-directed RNA polymerase subunit beta [Bacillus yapensis]
MSLDNSNQKVAETREQVKQAKNEMKAERESGEKRKRIRIRLIPLWLRLLIIAVLIVLCVILGAMFGYSVMGNGKATDVFEKSTWTHITDLIKKE